MARSRGTTGKNLGGIRSLDDVMARCRINDETGCWEWAGAMSTTSVPRAFVPPEVAERIGSNHKHDMTVMRLAWLLNGGKLEQGWRVWRSKCSCRTCVNPAHMKAGTVAQFGAELRRTGRMVGRPRKLAQLKQISMKRAAPAELIREAERLLAEGMTSKAVGAQLGLNHNIMADVRARRHVHSTTSAKACLPLASVFSWGLTHA